MRKTEQWKCEKPALVNVDWHDWLDEAQKWHHAYVTGELPINMTPQECLDASWRCLLRWASRIEFFNED